VIRRAAVLAALLLGASGAALAQEQPEAHDMALVGYSDLQGRSAYQPVIHQQGDRWIAYVGHHGGIPGAEKPSNPLTGQPEYNGTSLIDVTDPAHPEYLAHVPGETGNYEAGGAQMVRVCDGKSLPRGDPAAVYLLRPFGNQAHEVWNTADPRHPKLVIRVVDGLKGTHKSWWECDSGIAYLVSGAPGWRVTRMTQVFDLADPARPVKIRDFGLAGQQPGATGAVPTSLHGMIAVPQKNRIYFGYGTNQNGILQIVDRDRLLRGAVEPTEDNLRSPEVGRWVMPPTYGAHTTFPLIGIKIAEFAKDKVGGTRDFVIVTDEQIKNECEEARQFVWFVDVTAEDRPVSVATWGVPEAPGNFCSRGGRFGTHASNENMTPIYYGRVMFFSHFNAGVRVVDIRDPYHPKEIASYIPAVTERGDKRCVRPEGGQEHCARVIQTNNVEVDDRGLVYIVDRANNGMHILALTGVARAAANFPK